VLFGKQPFVPVKDALLADNRFVLLDEAKLLNLIR
jgi:hypothetical protein